MTATGIDRVCKILSSFNEDDPVLTLTQISQRMHLAKSTTHRLLAVLVDNGVLTPAGAEGYRLGYQVIRWGAVALATLDLRTVAMPYLRDLASQCHGTAVLAIRDGSTGMYIERVESRYPVKLSVRVGQQAMLHAGAVSKVLLAFLSEPEISRIVSDLDMPRMTERTITDPALLIEDLSRIRSAGYAASYEEVDMGAMGVAAPVYDGWERPVASVGIMAPAAVVPEDQVGTIAPVVLRAAQGISMQLGSKFEFAA